jgi:hypothetical protein
VLSILSNETSVTGYRSAIGSFWMRSLWRKFTAAVSEISPRVRLPADFPCRDGGTAPAPAPAADGSDGPADVYPT